MINKYNLVKKYKELVKINSYSGREREMADILRNELVKLGCKVKEDNTARKIKGDTGNLIAELSGNPDYPVLLLSAHMDRIDVSNNISIKIINDIIKGCGKSSGGDDLTGIVIILEILHQIQKYKLDNINLKIIFTVAEEKGLLGANNLSADELSFVDYGLVYDAEGEPGTIIHSSPAFASINVKLKGNKNKDAYRITTAIISEFNEIEVDRKKEFRIRVKKGSRKQGELFPVEMKGEIINYSSKELAKNIKKMKNIIGHSARKYNCQAEFSIENSYSGYNLNKNSDIIKMLKTAAINCNLSFRLLKCRGGSDANIFNELGTPTVNLGTGVLKAHSPEETVNINDMAKLVEYTLELFSVIKGNSHV